MSLASKKARKRRRTPFGEALWRLSAFDEPRALPLRIQRYPGHAHMFGSTNVDPRTFGGFIVDERGAFKYLDTRQLARVSAMRLIGREAELCELEAMVYNVTSLRRFGIRAGASSWSAT